MAKFERRLYIGFGVLVALVTPLLVAAFFVISELQSTQGDLLLKNAEDVIEAERLNSYINQEFALVQAFVLRGSAKAIQQLEFVHKGFQETTVQMLSKLDKGESPQLLEEAARLENEAFSYVKTTVGMKVHGATIAQINSYDESVNLTRGARILEVVRENVKVQTDQLHAARSQSDRIAKELVWGLVVACALALLATSAVVVLLFQMIRNKAQEDKQRDEKMKLQERLSTARKEVVEVVAHDLKNPLSSLKMSVELLQGELDDVIASRPDVGTGFHIANRSITSMQRLIDDQLDHTKIEAGQLEVECVLTNLSDILTEAELRFRGLAEAKGLKLTAKIERALLANIDPTRMEQVFSNLLGNAIKFTPSGGMIELCGRRQGEFVLIIVKDSGPGIAKDSLEHIFERYWQVRETASKGTGLGLSIAKGIVEAHGGKLFCKSEIGHGTEFEIRLSAAQLSRVAEMPH